jgi:hypothetical protein
MSSPVTRALLRRKKLFPVSANINILLASETPLG